MKHNYNVEEKDNEYDEKHTYYIAGNDGHAKHGDYRPVNEDFNPNNNTSRNANDEDYIEVNDNFEKLNSHNHDEMKHLTLDDFKAQLIDLAWNTFPIMKTKNNIQN